jgi:hypothetical protein
MATERPQPVEVAPSWFDPNGKKMRVESRSGNIFKFRVGFAGDNFLSIHAFFSVDGKTSKTNHLYVLEWQGIKSGFLVNHGCKLKTDKLISLLNLNGQNDLVEERCFIRKGDYLNLHDHHNLYGKADKNGFLDLSIYLSPDIKRAARNFIRIKEHLNLDSVLDLKMERS